MRGFKAGVYEPLVYMRRRIAALVASLGWPLLYLAFLFIGIYFTGRSYAYASTLGVNPAALLRFLPAAGFLTIAAGGIVDGMMMTVQGLRWSGILPYFLATPGATLRLLTGYTIGSTSVTLLLTSLPFILLSVGLAGIPGLIVILIVLGLTILAALTLLGLAALAAALTLLSNRERMPMIWMLPFLILVSAIFYPVTLLPPALRLVAHAVPLYYVSQALRNIASFLEAEKLLAVIGVLFGLGGGYASLYLPAAIAAREARKRSLD